MLPRTPFRSAAVRRSPPVLLAAALGCRPSDSVRIGFVGDLISELGAGGRNGAELAVETLNAGHAGRYELLVQDDRNDPGGRAGGDRVVRVARRGLRRSGR